MMQCDKDDVIIVQTHNLVTEGREEELTRSVSTKVGLPDIFFVLCVMSKFFPLPAENGIFVSSFYWHAHLKGQGGTPPPPPPP